MKIALLYTGRIESYDIYYNNLLKYIIKDHDVDIFLFHNKILDENLEPFINLYKPKIIINDYIQYNEINKPPHINGMYMFYSRKYIFSLFKDYYLKNNIHYDCVMIYRIDLLALMDINFDKLIFDDNVVNIPNIVTPGCGICDLLAIGNINSMEKYCNLADTYPNILSQTNYTDSNERILNAYLLNINININFFPFRCLLRDDIWESGGGKTCARNIDFKNTLFV